MGKFIESGMEGRKGFTLIELLVVIAIIGVLASIVLSKMIEISREKARDTRGETDLKQLLTAFEMKYNDEGKYPDLPDTATAIINTQNYSEILKPYLNYTPVSNGVRVYYWYDGGTNQKFCVYFQLEREPNKYFYASYKGIGYTDNPGCPNF